MDTAELLQRGYRYALSLTHDPQEAQDLLHDAWVRVLSSGAPQHKGYLFTTIRNGFVDRRRRGQVVRFESLDRPSADPQGSAEQGVGDKELVALVLAELRPEEREAIYLSAVEGYTAAEIGAMSGTTKNTVLSWLHRARKKVAEAFAPSVREGVR